MSRLSCWLALLAVVACVNLAAAFDEVLVVKRPVQKGTIVAMSATEVTLDVNRRKIPFKVNEIVGINFDLEPLELKTAHRFAASGQLDMALEKLENVKEADISREVILQDIAFYRAYAAAKLALGGGGDPKAAASAMFNFYKTYKENYHFYEAVEMMGNLAVASGEYESAAKYFSEFGQAPFASYKMRAKVLEGQALQSKREYAAALKNYEAVLGVTQDVEGGDEQKLFAILGKAACLAGTGKYDEGIKIVEDIVAQGDPNDISLFARAYNTMGQCYLESKKPKDALLAYLHTHILFYGEPEAHAEALYYLIKLWPQVDRPERAVEARKMLTERYRGSVWANKKD